MGVSSAASSVEGPGESPPAVAAEPSEAAKERGANASGSQESADVASTLIAEPVSSNVSRKSQGSIRSFLSSSSSKRAKTKQKPESKSVQSRAESAFDSDSASAADSASDSASGSDPDSGDSGSGSDSDSDGEEPLFKYSRVNRLPTTFFKRDAVSAVLVSDAVFVFATHSGVVHVAKPDMTPIRTSRIHRASVVDIDCEGQHVATASIDGTVVITAIDDAQDVAVANFKRPVHAVALDPNYRNTKAYLSGGTAGAVTRSEKGWLKARSDSVLFQSKSTVMAIRWFGEKVIWCNDEGITIYDMMANAIVERISRLPNSPPADLYHPRIAKGTNGTVLVTWASTLWVLDVHKDGHVLHTLNLDWLLSGAASFTDDKLLLLCSHAGSEPELRVVDYDAKEQYVDELQLADSARLGPNDYHLAGTGPFYLVSARDGVVAKQRDLRDHVEWLMERGEFAAAYRRSAGGVFDAATRRAIGLKAVQGLLDSKHFRPAAELLADVLSSADAADWTVWVRPFLSSSNATAIVSLGDNLPAAASSRELSSVRTEILLWAANHQPAKLAEYAAKWPVEQFDVSTVTAELEKANNPVLVRALANLYVMVGEPVQAVPKFLQIDSSEAFTVVSVYHLWSDSLKYLSALLKVDDLGEDVSVSTGVFTNLTQKRISILVSNRLQLPPRRVADQLTHDKEDQLLFWYLEQLMLVDEHAVREFGDALVKLYAEFDRDQLMGYLTHNDNYNLAQAVEICERENYTQELVFLLGKVGQPQKALDLIINTLEDADQAVQFVNGAHDKELWNYLVQSSLQKPAFVLRLLHCPQVSPARILSLVPDDLHIPGLRQALHHVFLQQAALMALNTGALAIVQTEAQRHLAELQAARLRGSEITPSDDENWGEAVLITRGSRVSVLELEKKSPSSAPPVTGFADKIRHLGRLLKLV